MKSEIYQQCLLCKGLRVITSWIPVAFCRKGTFVELKVDGKWVNGWEIIDLSNTKITREELNTLETQYKWTRKASDI